MWCCCSALEVFLTHFTHLTQCEKSRKVTNIKISLLKLHQIVLSVNFWVLKAAASTGRFPSLTTRLQSFTAAFWETRKSDEPSADISLAPERRRHSSLSHSARTPSPQTLWDESHVTTALLGFVHKIPTARKMIVFCSSTSRYSTLKQLDVHKVFQILFILWYFFYPDTSFFLQSLCIVFRAALHRGITMTSLNTRTFNGLI